MNKELELHEIKVKLSVVLRHEEDGHMVAECPTVNGCITQGKTREQALENIKKEIEMEGKLYFAENGVDLVRKVGQTKLDLKGKIEL